MEFGTIPGLLANFIIYCALMIDNALPSFLEILVNRQLLSHCTVDFFSAGPLWIPDTATCGSGDRRAVVVSEIRVDLDRGEGCLGVHLFSPVRSSFSFFVMNLQKIPALLNFIAPIHMFSWTSSLFSFFLDFRTKCPTRNSHSLMALSGRSGNEDGRCFMAMAGGGLGVSAERITGLPEWYMSVSWKI